MNNVLTIQISNHAVERAQMRGVGPSASDRLRLAALYGTKVGLLPWEKGIRKGVVRILDRKALRTVTKAYPHLSTIQIEDLNGIVVATTDNGAGQRTVTTTFRKFTGGTRQWYRQNERYYRKLATNARAKRSRSQSFIDFDRNVEEQDSDEQDSAIKHPSDVRGPYSLGIDRLRAAA